MALRVCVNQALVWYYKWKKVFQILAITYEVHCVTQYCSQKRKDFIDIKSDIVKWLDIDSFQCEKSVDYFVARKYCC